MASKISPTLLTRLILPTFLFVFLYIALFSISPASNKPRPTSEIPILSQPSCNLFRGKWVLDPTRKPLYDAACPFHRNAWNCIRNGRENTGRISNWRWVPNGCGLDRVDPVGFLNLMRNKNVGFVGDSLNENFLVALLCVLRVGDGGAKKWKRRGAWRGAYFPKFNVTVAYHRAVLLAKYEWQANNKPNISSGDGIKGIYRVDVDTPANDWARIADFYDVLVFNTGHWWGEDKFPKETPLVFYERGWPMQPPLEMYDGLKAVLRNMVAHIERVFPDRTLKFWRLQSPRHFHGGDWNQNGSCLFGEPLRESQLDPWFDPRNNGVNREARVLNRVIEEALTGSGIAPLDLTRLSEYRADGHPAAWLGKKDAVAVWGQDCMHWCLPGVPDTWVDVLAQLIRRGLEEENIT